MDTAAKILLFLLVAIFFTGCKPSSSSGLPTLKTSARSFGPAGTLECQNHSKFEINVESNGIARRLVSGATTTFTSLPAMSDFRLSVRTSSGYKIFTQTKVPTSAGGIVMKIR